jgi:hypothetical protein
VKLKDERTSCVGMRTSASDTLGCVGKHTVNLVLVLTEVEVVGLVRLSWVVWGTGTPKDRVEVVGVYATLREICCLL